MTITENMNLYPALISHRVGRQGLVNMLGKTGWVRNRDGSVKKFGGSIQRRAAVLWANDLVQFDVGDRGLDRVLIQTGVPTDGSKQEFLGRWAALKAKVSRDLGRPGLSTDCSDEQFEQRCVWAMSDVDVTARAFRKWYKWKIEFDISRRQPAAEGCLTPSLEEYFIQ